MSGALETSSTSTQSVEYQRASQPALRVHPAGLAQKKAEEKRVQPVGLMQNNAEGKEKGTAERNQRRRGRKPIPEPGGKRNH